LLKKKILIRVMFALIVVVFASIVMTVDVHAEGDTTEEFIEEIGEDCREIAGDNDLYASVMLAQAILESSSGTSGLSIDPYYNLFGIKGDYNGMSAVFYTQECAEDGTYYTIQAAFRQYPSWRESLEDYKDLLRQDYYAGTWKSNTNSYEDVTAYLQGRYATSDTYARDLNWIIKTYDLTRFDVTCAELQAIEDSKTAAAEAQAEKETDIKLKQLDELSDLSEASLPEDEIKMREFDPISNPLFIPENREICNPSYEFLTPSEFNINVTKGSATKEDKGIKLDYLKLDSYCEEKKFLFDRK